MRTRLHRPLALAALFALSACSGGGGNSAPPLVPSTPPPATLLTNIVGVGDSLTAGEQSGTIMGVPGMDPRSPLPGHITPPTQENGWWGLFYLAAHGIPADPAHFNLTTVLGQPFVTPLPLINQPGIGGQILATSTGLFTTHLSCDAFDRAAYQSASALSTNRVSGVNRVYDVAVPGITMHEALYMHAPLTGAPPPPAGNPPSCPSYATLPNDPTSGGLQSLVQDESAMFYPVLGTFANVHPLTMVGAAVSLQPTLTTVWLGANDLLKYTFSAGASPISDTPQQMGTDLATIVKTLQAHGSKVMVANLPTILQTPQFFRGGVQPVPSQSVYFYLLALSSISPTPITPPQAQAIVTALQTQCGVGPNGYLEEGAFFSLFAAIEQGKYDPASTTCILDPNGPKSGVGAAYLTDAFAARVSALNAAYNQAIASAASGTGATLVDVNGALTAIYQAGGYQIPGAGTVSLLFGGGIVSFDGLHPSTVGYGLVANLFIGAADKAYGLHIPPYDLAQFYPYDPYRIPGL